MYYKETSLLVNLFLSYLKISLYTEIIIFPPNTYNILLPILLNCYWITIFSLYKCIKFTPHRHTSKDKILEKSENEIFLFNLIDFKFKYLIYPLKLLNNFHLILNLNVFHSWEM